MPGYDPEQEVFERYYPEYGKPFRIAHRDLVTGLATVDHPLVIPNSTTMHVVGFEASSESGSFGQRPSKVELLYDYTGSGSPVQIIAVAYCANSASSYRVNYPFRGNGTARLILRRSRLNAGDYEIYGCYYGWLE